MNDRILPQVFRIDGSVQDCSISSWLAMEMLQPCTKQLVYSVETFAQDLPLCQLLA